jgi:hypothetical protein
MGEGANACWKRLEAQELMLTFSLNAVFYVVANEGNEI